MRDSDTNPPADYKDNTFHSFDVSKILPGDILLTASPGGKNSKIIRKMTKSDFSHAAICTEPGIFVEAIGTGVHRVYLGRMAVRDLANVKLLRLKQTVENHKQIAETSAQKGETLLSRKYWLEGAIKSILNSQKATQTTKFFCSHLVAHAYREAGYELVPNRTAEEVYPGAILENDSLEDITDRVVVPQIPVKWMLWTFLEDKDNETPHSAEVKIMQSVFEHMAGVFESHGVPSPADYYDALMSLVKIEDKAIAGMIDSEFAATLESKGYAMLVDLDRFPNIKKALFIDKDVEAGLAEGAFSESDIQGLLRMYKSNLAIFPQQIERRRLEATMWQRLYSKTQFETLALLGKVAETMRDRQEQIARATERAVQLLEFNDTPAS